MLEVYDELFEQFFLFIKTYLWDSFFLGKTNIGTCFFLPKKQCFSCLLVGKVLPSHWQGFATALAKLCHRHGKKFAKGKASGWQNFLLTDSELCGWQQSVSSASEYSPSQKLFKKGREDDCSSIGLDGKNRMRFSPMAATALSLRRCGTVPPSSLPAAWLSGCRGNWESL